MNAKTTLAILVALSLSACAMDHSISLTRDGFEYSVSVDADKLPTGSVSDEAIAERLRAIWSAVEDARLEPPEH